jgi:hypothetical protein
MDMVTASIAFSLVYHTIFPVKRQKPSRFDFFPKGILTQKGGRTMKLSGLAITAGLGAAAGAVTAMMLPKRSTTRKALQKAAYAVEDAAMNLGGKMANKMDM